MSVRQRTAIFTPVMYPVFHALAGAFRENWRIAWYLGLVVYWLVWGAVFPLCILGKEPIARIVRPRRLNGRVLILVLVPLIGAALFRFVPGLEYQKPSVWILFLLLSTNLGNGFFEEVLWRGVYMELFPDSLMFRIVWPGIWFALWHYVPGSVNPGGNVAGLMIGSGLMGFYLSFLANKTGTIWWTIVGHTLGAVIMVV